MQNCLHLQLCALHFLRLSRQFSDDFVRRRNRSVSQHKVSNLNNGLCRLRYSLNLYSLVTLFREFILRRLRHWCGWLYRKVFHQVFGHANAGFECTRAKNNQGKSKLKCQALIFIQAIRAKYGGQVSGIIIGCLIGMCPLLFIKHDEDSD